MSKHFLRRAFILLSLSSLAHAATQEYLVRFRAGNSAAPEQFLKANGGSLELISEAGNLYKWVSNQALSPAWDANVAYVQNNHKLGLLKNPSIEANRAAILAALSQNDNPPFPFPLPTPDQPGPQPGPSPSPIPFPFPDQPGPTPTTKPAIQTPPAETHGTDPMLQQAWGMFTIAADKAWQKTPQGKDIVVAVTDTGIDYNHEDLIANVWRNKNEIPDNNIDDDKNGYVDDIIGWDFVTNDNKPYDITGSLMDILLKGANPGHGTHCSGVVGARLNNGLGTAGVAPQVKIMPLRFISEKGQGDDAAAIKAIDYAVKNGANIISASWGGEAGKGDDDNALKEAIQRAQAAGVLFVAAAGNGHESQGGMTPPMGFDNDTDPHPIIPASFPLDNIVAVAAIDSNGALASFSNYGKKSVAIAAPGVKILSTVPGNKYQDTVIDMGGIKATWDGTSMATPFVAGSLAEVWSMDKNQTWQAVKAKLLANALLLDSVKGKVQTDGRVDLSRLAQ